MQKADCIGLKVKLTQSGIADFPDRVRRETTVDPNGQFIFTKVSKLSYGVEIEKSNFCWVKTLHRVNLDADNITGLVFQQNGYELVINSSYTFDAFLVNANDPD